MISMRSLRHLAHLSALYTPSSGHRQKAPRRIQRLGTIAASAFAFMVAFAGVASAHVTVWPQTSTVGAWEKYTMRVPTEKNDPTVKIVLKIPAGVSFEQYESVPGWQVTEQKDASGRVTAVTWTAQGTGIPPGQFQEFAFVAQNPQKPGELAWNAYQYYKDGTIVEWTGPEGASTPHSVTTILAQTAPTVHAPMPSTTQTAGVANNTWPLVLSVIALVVSLLSAALSWARRK